MADMRQEIAASAAFNPMQATFQAWRQLNGPMVAAMSDLNKRMIDQLTRAGNEWNGFITRRIEEDIAASRRLMQCRTAQDVLSTYADFLTRAQSQYLAELQYFTRLNQRFADETSRLMRVHSDESGRAWNH